MTRWWRNTRLVTYYARAAAVVLVLSGLSGFAHVLSWALLPSFYHVALGLLFGYVGLFVRDKEVMRQTVGILGALMVTVKGITLLALLLLGEDPLWGPTEITCFVVGITSILVARYLRDPN